MFSTDDTIVAIATPAGRGGIGVVRISGPSAVEVANALLQLDSPLRPRYATFARTQGDQVVATYFPAPHSYTGEHVVEISAHGSPSCCGRSSTQAMRSARGWPSRRVHAARISQRPIDLVQAEAVADLIDAVTPLQARAASINWKGR
jgi:tRNA modification GTPase